MTTTTTKSKGEPTKTGQAPAAAEVAGPDLATQAPQAQVEGGLKGEVIQPLSAAEARALKSAEAAIDRGIRAYFDAGAALHKIRSGRLYRAEYNSFGEYVEERWELSRSRANQLADASTVAADLSTIVAPGGINEGQARVLVPLPSDQRRLAYQAAQDALAKGEKLTAAKLSAAVAEVTGKSKSEPTAEAAQPEPTAEAPTQDEPTSEAAQPEPTAQEPTQDEPTAAATMPEVQPEPEAATPARDDPEPDRYDPLEEPGPFTRAVLDALDSLPYEIPVNGHPSLITLADLDEVLILTGLSVDIVLSQPILAAV